MTVIYTTSFQEERLDEDRWNRFFSCRFRFYFYFFFFFRRSFVSSLNDAPGWCQKQVKTVKLNTLLVLSLLMPQIVNHKKREVKATHKHTHTHTRTHTDVFNEINVQKLNKNKAPHFWLVSIDACSVFFPRILLCFLFSFYRFYSYFDWLSRHVVDGRRTQAKWDRRLSMKFIAYNNVEWHLRWWNAECYIRHFHSTTSRSAEGRMCTMRLYHSKTFFFYLTTILII